MLDGRKVSAFNRATHVAVYNQSENIRAASAWYQALDQDITDANNYGRLAMPVLGISSYISYSYLPMSLPYMAENVQVGGILDSGHYLFEEKPAQVPEAVLGFLHLSR